MTTQSEMKLIVKNVLNELSKIESYMTRYDKLKIQPVNWGGMQFAAYDFLQSVKEEIKKINLALSAYIRPDLQHIYANRNFDDYVNEIRKNLKIMQKKFDNFKKYEYKPYYIALSVEDLKVD